MGNLRMNADQISYKGGEKPMSVEEAIKNAGNTGLAHTADIAPDFSAESAYNAGDLVYHNGTLYVFTSNHAAGAWSSEDTQAVTVGNELSTLMSGLTSVTTLQTPTTRSGVTLVSGGYQKIGRIVMVSVVITMTETITNPNTGILWGFPSDESVNIPMLICEEGKNTFETGKTTRIWQDTIYSGMELTSGKTYTINGIYETAS